MGGLHAYMTYDDIYVHAYMQDDDTFVFVRNLMMTLGKDPPTLDDALEDAESSKYGKPFKKIIEKKSQKEDAKKEKKINWEEEKDVIESYFCQRHPMISKHKRKK